MQLHLKFALLVTAGLFVTGCGQQNCRLTALSVSPTSATLDHLAAAPGNQGQFWNRDADLQMNWVRCSEGCPAYSARSRWYNSSSE